MALVPMALLLQEAQKEGYAVGAFNANYLEIVQGIVEAAVELNSPVILQASQGAIKYAGLDYLVAIVRAASEKVRVPVALNLDHGASFEQAVQCIRGGFSAVMFDGSKYPFAENVALTLAVGRVARAAGVSLEGELGRIVDREWEVGLHGGYYACNDLEEIAREKGRLEQVLGRKVTGYRNHYLRFQVPDSWEILEKAGFRYDTTLGYPDMVGFRNGMCHPFWPYNLRTNMEVGILEIPMVIMDVTLFNSTRSYSEAWQMAKALIDTVVSCHGVLTLNWHSNSFGCPFRGSWSRLYEKILQHCDSKNAWMTSGIEICKWWRYNDFKPTR